MKAEWETKKKMGGLSAEGCITDPSNMRLEETSGG
jgi:hypothetical protein